MVPTQDALFIAAIEAITAAQKRAPMVKTFLVSASDALAAGLSGRKLTTAQFNAVARRIAFDAFDLAIRSPEVPSQGALRDRGAESGRAALLEVMS